MSTLESLILKRLPHSVVVHIAEYLSSAPLTTRDLSGRTQQVQCIVRSVLRSRFPAEALTAEEIPNEITLQASAIRVAIVQREFELAIKIISQIWPIAVIGISGDIFTKAFGSIVQHAAAFNRTDIVFAVLKQICLITKFVPSYTETYLLSVMMDLVKCGAAQMLKFVLDVNPLTQNLRFYDLHSAAAESGHFHCFKLLVDRFGFWNNFIAVREALYGGDHRIVSYLMPHVGVRYCARLAHSVFAKQTILKYLAEEGIPEFWEAMNMTRLFSACVDRSTSRSRRVELFNAVMADSNFKNPFELAQSWVENPMFPPSPAYVQYRGVLMCVFMSEYAPPFTQATMDTVLKNLICPRRCRPMFEGRELAEILEFFNGTSVVIPQWVLRYLIRIKPRTVSMQFLEPLFDRFWKSFTSVLYNNALREQHWNAIKMFINGGVPCTAVFFAKSHKVLRKKLGVGMVEALRELVSRSLRPKQNA